MRRGRNEEYKLRIWIGLTTKSWTESKNIVSGERHALHSILTAHLKQRPTAETVGRPSFAMDLYRLNGDRDIQSRDHLSSSLSAWTWHEFNIIFLLLQLLLLIRTSLSSFSLLLQTHSLVTHYHHRRRRHGVSMLMVQDQEKSVWGWQTFPSSPSNGERIEWSKRRATKILFLALIFLQQNTCLQVSHTFQANFLTLLFPYSAFLHFFIRRFDSLPQLNPIRVIQVVATNRAHIYSFTFVLHPLHSIADF